MSTTPVSPKLTHGANFAGYATLGLTILDSFTPDSFAFLGKYAPLAYGAVIGAAYALGVYLKEDPLRTAGAQAEADAQAQAKTESLGDNTAPVVGDASAAPTDVLASLANSIKPPTP